MTIAYDLYGAKGLCLSSARERVERVLGVAFEERDSSYQGAYYMWGESNSEHIVLKVNVDPFDGGPVEQSCPDYTILLYVNATERSSYIEEAIRQAGGFKFIRHEMF